MIINLLSNHVCVCWNLYHNSSSYMKVNLSLINIHQSIWEMELMWNRWSWIKQEYTIYVIFLEKARQWQVKEGKGWSILWGHFTNFIILRAWKIVQFYSESKDFPFEECFEKSGVMGIRTPKKRVTTAKRRV